eukprot:6201082-Pleurochrysis_carterae.AAC.3
MTKLRQSVQFIDVPCHWTRKRRMDTEVVRYYNIAVKTLFAATTRNMCAYYVHYVYSPPVHYQRAELSDRAASPVQWHIARQGAFALLPVPGLKQRVRAAPLGLTPVGLS